MHRATCQCGQELKIETAGTPKVMCPRCGAAIRVRWRTESIEEESIRFTCPCGQKLKVPATQAATFGRCPRCNRVVPVPASASRDFSAPDADTIDLTPLELAALDAWARGHAGPAANIDPDRTPVHAQPSPPIRPNQAEAGLRICPNCDKPVHLSATVCRNCGTPVPRK
jgi:predicted RNA-binding Zn-ribbon protein involved in translation (DUF1610 family)